VETINANLQGGTDTLSYAGTTVDISVNLGSHAQWIACLRATEAKLPTALPAASRNGSMSWRGPTDQDDELKSRLR
jgi:hypothetical protein